MFTLNIVEIGPFTTLYTSVWKNFTNYIFEKSDYHNNRNFQQYCKVLTDTLKDEYNAVVFSDVFSEQLVFIDQNNLTEFLLRYTR